MRNKKYFFNIALILIIGGVSIYLSIGKQFDQVIHAFEEARISWIAVMGIVMFSYYLSVSYTHLDVYKRQDLGFVIAKDEKEVVCEREMVFIGVKPQVVEKVLEPWIDLLKNKALISIVLGCLLYTSILY